MKESFIAKVYAQSLFELGKSENVDIAEELTALVATIRENNSFENALFLQVFTTDEKLDVFKGISKKMGLSKIVVSTCLYLISEKRMNLLPMIYKELIVLDDDAKGFMRGTIEGHKSEVNSELKEKIKAFLKSKTGKDPILEYVQNSNITAGYKVTADDLQLDASLDNVLEQFKQEVLN